MSNSSITQLDRVFELSLSLFRRDSLPSCYTEPIPIPPADHFRIPSRIALDSLKTPIDSNRIKWDRSQVDTLQLILNGICRTECRIFQTSNEFYAKVIMFICS